MTVKPTGRSSIPTRGDEILLKFIFAFLRSDSRLSAALSSTTQHTMPSEFGRKWETECFNARFPLPTLQFAGYSVKLIYLFYLRLELNNVTSLVNVIVARIQSRVGG